MAADVSNDAANVTVSVPQDAVVSINGQRTHSTGTERVYSSAGLAPATATRTSCVRGSCATGRWSSRTRKLFLHVGESKTVTINFPRGSNATPTPGALTLGPGGASENSPAIHRWESGSTQSCRQSRKGRLKCNAAGSVVPSGLSTNLGVRGPSDESLGYDQASLRDGGAVVRRYADRFTARVKFSEYPLRKMAQKETLKTETRSGIFSLNDHTRHNSGQREENGALQQALDELLRESLRRGFFGTAAVELNVQDGTIQHIRRKVERIEK